MKPTAPQAMQKLLGNRQALEQLSRSSEAKALMDLISKGHNESSLQEIAQNAAKGDTAQLAAVIRTITSTPGGAQLLQKLSKQMETK